ncbi:MAG: DUF4176 domain-containing protein [Erysipelotrichaceae bacterium]|nr:DUF4176 domain-containing protein [Erysipelotrichaceae bacterium]
MEIKDLLPVGSVVLLKDGTKKLSIMGILQSAPEAEKVFDYMAVPYPEGFMDTSKTYLFNHEQIRDIVHLGPSDEEREKFMEGLSNILTMLKPSNRKERL